MLCGALIFSSVTSTSVVFASEPVVQNDKGYVDNIVKDVEKFMEIDEKGIHWFNDKAAIENGADEKIIDAGRLYNAFSARNGGWDSSAPTHYGNWCGLGNTGEGPIDVLDYYCFKHDKCYESNGWGDKTCDDDFVDALKANGYRIKNMDYSARIYAAAAVVYFSGKGFVRDIYKKYFS